MSEGTAPATPKRYLKPREAAAEIGQHVNLIRQMIKAGTLPAVNLSEGKGRATYLIRREDLEAVMRPPGSTAAGVREAPTTTPPPPKRRQRIDAEDMAEGRGGER